MAVTPCPIGFWVTTQGSHCATPSWSILKTQELAGIDVIADGELNRFNPSHPETNGMIDYFVSRMDGIGTRFSVSDLDKFRSDAGLTYRAEPAGIVTGEIARARSICRAILT